MDYIVGIDGGGTKTEAVVIDTSGNRLFGCTGESTNSKAIGFEQASRHLEAVLDKVLQHEACASERCLAVCIGMAGTDTAEEKQAVEAVLRAYQTRVGAAFEVFVRNDAEIVLMASLRREYGIAVVSGTGSIVFGCTPEGRRYRVGGWGHLLGDEGSGYQIGLHALQAVMRSHDGICPATALTDMIRRTYGLDSITELKTYIYGPDIRKKDVAAFAELCINASKQGDAVAVRIIEGAAAELAVAAAALVRKDAWFPDSDLVTTGSVFKHSPLFADTFRQTISETFPGLRLHPASEQPAAYGAALLGFELFQRTR